MNPRITITIFLLIVGGLVAIMPKVENKSYEIAPDEMLVEIQKSNNYFSIEEVADLLINEDPEILLIDLRSKEEYDKFSLPNSINIPFEDLLKEEWEAYIDQDARKNIFYSNGSLKSSEAWLITTRLGYKNNYILTGGVNEWFHQIVLPEEPDMSEDSDVFDNYEMRLAARAYFYGGTTIKTKKTKPVLTVKKKKRKTAEGGCS